MNNILEKVKSYLTMTISYYKTKGDIKIIGFGLIFGILTFSSWAAFFLFLVTCWIYFLAKKTVPNSIASMVNLDYNKYILNSALGLFISSIILLIV